VKWMTALMISSFLTAVGPAFGEEKKEQPALRFSLPPSNTLNWSKPVKCTAIASAALFEETPDMQDFKQAKLSVYVKKGTDKLRLYRGTLFKTFKMTVYMPLGL